jgi:hypothetical protein
MYLPSLLALLSPACFMCSVRNFELEGTWVRISYIVKGMGFIVYV